MLEAIATKFIDWSYEEEVRFFVDLSTTRVANDLHFVDYSNDLKLKKVILGPKCALKIKEINEAVKDSCVETVVSRLAFQSFRVVEQKNQKLR